MRLYPFTIALGFCAASMLYGQTSRGAVLQPGYRMGDNPIVAAPLQILNLPVLGLELGSSRPAVVPRMRMDIIQMSPMASGSLCAGKRQPSSGRRVLCTLLDRVARKQQHRANRSLA